MSLNFHSFERLLSYPSVVSLMWVWMRQQRVSKQAGQFNSKWFGPLSDIVTFPVLHVAYSRSLTVRQQFTVRVGRLDSGYMGGRSNTSAKSEIAYIFSYFYSTTDVAFILG